MKGFTSNVSKKHARQRAQVYLKKSLPGWSRLPRTQVLSIIIFVVPPRRRGGPIRIPHNGAICEPRADRGPSFELGAHRFVQRGPIIYPQGSAICGPGDDRSPAVGRVASPTLVPVEGPIGDPNGGAISGPGATRGPVHGTGVDQRRLSQRGHRFQARRTKGIGSVSHFSV
jgi:hypothetical protein